jgi:Tfp pilus assembly protein PilO
VKNFRPLLIKVHLVVVVVVVVVVVGLGYVGRVPAAVQRQLIIIVGQQERRSEKGV